MRNIKTPKKILTSEVCFLCKAKVSSEENIKVDMKRNCPDLVISTKLLFFDVLFYHITILSETLNYDLF